MRLTPSCALTTVSLLPHVCVAVPCDSPGLYCIVVAATSAATSDATFTVTAKSDVSASALQDGESVQDTVPPHAYRYYSLAVGSAVDVVFDLTPIAGDADLFISCTKNLTTDDTGTPSRLAGHYTWSSQRWGADSITVHGNDPASCAAQTATGGTFYIAVYGFMNSTYTILGSINDGACRCPGACLAVVWRLCVW